MKRNVCLAAVFLVGVLLTSFVPQVEAQAAQKPQFFVRLMPLPAGADPASVNMYPTSINERGELAGYATNQSGEVAPWSYTFPWGSKWGAVFPGTNQQSSLSLNTRGVMVGYFNDPSGTTPIFPRAYLQDRRLVALNCPEGCPSQATSINEASIKAGVVWTLPDSNNRRHGQATKWDATNRHQFLTGLPPQWTDSFANDININGDVVGWGGTMNNRGGFDNKYAYIWSNGTFRDIGNLGYEWTLAAALNDKGMVVGHGYTQDFELHAFLWNKTTIRDLGTLEGHIESVAYCINSRGDLIGGYSKPSEDEPPSAVVWYRGRIYDLNDPQVTERQPGRAFTKVVGVNDDGQLAVQGMENGMERAYRFQLRTWRPPW